MSARVAIIGDLHLGKSIRGYDRTPDIVAAWERAVEEAVTAGCRYLIQTGDVFDDSHPSPELAALAARLFATATPRFPGGVSVLVGNHDLRHGEDRADALAPIRELAPDGLSVHASPEATLLFGPESYLPVAKLLLLPYESRSRRGWDTPEEYDHLIRGLLSQWDGDPDAERLPILVAGHLDIEGAVTASEVPARGGGHPWPRGVGWRSRVSCAVDGHWHKPQTVEWYGWRIHCVGTPVALDFGEAGEVKRWMSVDVG